MLETLLNKVSHMIFLKAIYSVIGIVIILNFSLYRKSYFSLINLFDVTGLFLLSLKISENQRSSDMFKAYKRDRWQDMGFYILL